MWFQVLKRDDILKAQVSAHDYCRYGAEYGAKCLFAEKIHYLLEYFKFFIDQIYKFFLV